MRSKGKDRVTLLKERLDELYLSYGTEYLHSDPLQFPHRYDEPRDREIAAFIASVLAYGNVTIIKKSLERLFLLLGPSPHDALLHGKPERFLAELDGFKHRFTTGRHLSWLFLVVKQALREFGSLRVLFLQNYSPGEVNTKRSLASFVDHLLAYDPGPLYPNLEAARRDGALFLLPSPESGAACKRLNLFLRWVVRSADNIDLGLWPEVRAGQLVIPLDTHIARISRLLGLTARKGSDWRTAEEITESLRTLDPDDPLKYDFSLTRLGILGSCVARKNLSRCRDCSLVDICLETGAGGVTTVS